MSEIPYKHICVLIMPTDYFNMNCVYCFNSRRSATEKNIISDENLKKIFDITIPYYEDIRFIWHGGEPLSVGKEFYENVLKLQSEYNTKNTTIKNSIQTNLSLMTDDFAKFLVENNFYVGSSFDGTKNEFTRHNTAKILEGHETLKKAGGHNGFICVIQNENINSLKEDYEWFKSNGINYNLNKYLSADNKNDKLYVPPKIYAQKICEFFDYWMFDKSCNISVSYYDNFIKYILFNEKNLCCYNSCMGKHIGIHYDGNIYGCNRDFPDKYCYGNINDYSDIHQCFESKGFKELLKDSIERRKRCKEKCKIYDFCAGGCNSVALTAGDIKKNNQEDCHSLFLIYSYIEEKINKWKNEDENEIAERLNPYVSKLLLKYKKGGKEDGVLL